MELYDICISANCSVLFLCNKNNFSEEELIKIENSTCSNCIIVHSVKDLYQKLTLKSFKYVAIDVNFFTKARIVEISDLLIASTRTICLNSRNQQPILCAYGLDCGDVTVINALLKTKFDIIDLNFNNDSIHTWNNKNQLLQSGRKYIDSETAQLIDKSSYIDTNTNKEAMIAYTVAPISINNITQPTRIKLHTQFNWIVKDLDNILDLLVVLGCESLKVDAIFIDNEMINNILNTSMYDAINMVYTMIGITNRRNLTKIFVVVDKTTPVQFIKELANNNRINGVIGRPGWLTYNELYDQLKDCTFSNRFVMIKKIKAFVNTKKSGTNKSILTPREQEVLDLIISTGAGNKEIANKLKVSDATVKIYVGNLLKKYCVTNRTELILKAR